MIVVTVAVVTFILVQTDYIEINLAYLVACPYCPVVSKKLICPMNYTNVKSDFSTLKNDK